MGGCGDGGKGGYRGEGGPADERSLDAMLRDESESAGWRRWAPYAGVEAELTMRWQKTR